MRWGDERYVKVYTRDTPDWLALGWEAHALFWELLRKSDRAGLFELGKSGTKGIAAVTGIPCDVVDRALSVLIEDGCVERHGGYLLIRNFIEAQDANQSDKARQQKAREIARDKARLETVKPSQTVTVINDDVTDCDVKSGSVTGTALDVTPRLEEKRREETGGSPARARDPMARTRPRTAHDLIFALKVSVEKHQPQNGMWNPGGSFSAKEAREFLDGFGDDLEAALDTIEARIELFAKDPEMRPWTVKKFSASYNGIGQPKRQQVSRQSGPEPFTWNRLPGT